MDGQPVKKLIVNELLAYVNTYRNSSTTYHLKSAVLQHYCVEDIGSARGTMVEHVKDIIPQFPNLGAKRTDSVNRTAREIMVVDIIDMYKALDKCNGDDVPIFVAANVKNLPPASPEVAADIMSVMETVASQQRQLAELLDAVTSIRKDVEKNKESLVNRDHEPVIRSTISVSAPVAKSGYQESHGLPKPGGHVRKLVAGQSKQYSEALSKPTEKRNETVSQSDNSRVMVTGDANVEQQELRTPEVRDNEGANFQPQKKRPNKGVNKGQGHSRPTVSRVSGTADNNRLRAGPKVIQLQITNVNSEMTEKDIEDYITSTGDQTVAAEKVEDMSSPNWDTKRFVLTFKIEHREAVTAPGFWPKDIYFKRWFKAKNKQD